MSSRLKKERRKKNLRRNLYCNSAGGGSSLYFSIEVCTQSQLKIRRGTLLVETGGADEWLRGWLVMFIGPARIISTPHPPPQGLWSSIARARARTLTICFSLSRTVPTIFSSLFRASPFPPRRRSFLYMLVYIGI